MTTLENKMAVVTGSGRGIGQQIAFRLARAGAGVVACCTAAVRARAYSSKCHAGLHV